MTKKHFIAFAARMKEDLDNAKLRFDEAEYKRTKDAVTYAAYAFADVATRDNNRFDRDRFFTACGLR